MKNVFKKTILAVALFIGSAGFVSAQLAMTRSTFTGTYTAITTGGGATTSTASGDDAVQTAIPVGFTFNYLGINYTTVSINTNGLVGFGTLAAVDRDNANFYTATAPNLVLAPWFDDLSTPVGNLLYQLQGTPGSQTFTIQWSALTYYTGSTALADFQVILYEGTNVIEFRYGAQPTGTFSATESATIGIDGAGGNGLYLDATTGSAFTGNGMLSANTMWPSRFYRFTPGVPTILAGGTYTVGNAGTYFSLSEAIADINHRGISGAITLSLLDANYDRTVANGRNFFPMLIGPVTGSSAVNTITIAPASGTSTITSPGASGGQCPNQATAAAIGTGTEPVFGVIGGQYISVNNINFVASSNLVDRGLAVLNSSAIAGSQNNTFTNIGVTLNRTNTATIAIDQRLPTTPTGSTGANSTNAYMNLTISNTYNGIYLNGNATFPDLNCSIGNTSPTAWNSIGSATANDIGNGTALSYGIRCTNQSGVSVYNNEVRNVTVTAAVTCDGIFMETSQGICNVYMNKVHDLRNTSTTATTAISGIRGNVATTAGHNLRIYNNWVYGLTSGYTGAATATRQIRGLNLQSAGGGLVTSQINADNNNINIDASSSPNASSSALDIGTTSGPIINVRNNILCNATGAQVAPAGHYGWVSTSATLTGNTGSVSNYNDLYVANTTEGYVGRGNTTNYATLAAWQAGMIGQDINSLSTDPSYTSATNLHVNAPSLDGVATSLAWVTVDIDNQTRAVTPDIGADEFVVSLIDMGATMLVTPVAGACYLANENVTIRIRNYAGTTINFAVDPVVITVNITGAITATITYTVNTGTLASSATQDVLVGTANMTTAGTYTFNASTAVGGDGNAANDAMTPMNITFGAGAAVSSPSNVCAGSSTTLTLTGNTASSLQWQVSTDGGVTWNSIVGATTTPYVYTPTDTSVFRALVCGLILSTLDTTNYIPTTAPVTVGDTACGTSTVNLSATGNPILYWYTAASGGTPINTGSTYSPTISATDTFYVESSSGASAGAHTTTYAAGNGASGNVFAIQATVQIEIDSFDIHCSSTVGTSTTWEVWYRPNDYLLTPGSQNSSVGWTQVGVGSTLSAGTGVGTRIPFAINVTIPAGSKYSFMICATSGSVAYTNGTTTGAVYNSNADLTVFQGHGGALFALPNNPRVFNGRIYYSSGCQSARTPVIAVITPAPAVVGTSSNDVCGSGTSTLMSNSVNTNYTYGWAPAGSLNTAVGDSVIASPSGPVTYTVTGTDASTGCVDTAHVYVGWNPAPDVIASASPDTICSGATTNLDAQPASIMQYTIGTNTIQNSATTYPAPYGNFYWGARHQILITAADLTASGMIPGYYSGLEFFATNLNISQPLTAFEIKMGMSPQTTIATWYAGPMTSLYLNPSYSPVVGANMHAFSTTFYWDGVSSIIIETCFNNGSYMDNVSMEQTTTSYSSCIYYRADAAGVCANPALTGTANQRPVIRFSRSTAGYGYTWTPGASLDNPMIQNPVGTPMITTDYVVTVLDTATGCTAVDTVVVTVNQTPDPNFGPDTSICSNAVLLLDGTAGLFTYLWQDMSTNQTYTVNTMGTYDVMVTDTATGCAGADTITVGIDAAPSFTLGSDVTVCEGTQVTFTGPSGQFEYMWNTTDTTISVSTTVAGSYELEVTDSVNGCASMDTVMLNVNPVPATALGADTNMCSANGSLTLSGPAGMYEYLWSTSDTTMSISVSTSGAYAVLVTDTATGCYSSDSILVNYNTSPVASIGNDTAFCSASGPLTLMGPSGPYMYMWSDMTTGASTTASSTGNYYLDITDSLTGCTASDSVMITVNMSPAVALSDTTACGSQVTLMGPAGPYAYMWNTAATTQSIAASSSGSYAVTVTDTISGCTGVDSANVTLNSNPTVTASASSMTPCADDANVTLTGSPAGGTFSGTSVTGNQFDPSVGAGTYQIMYNYTDVNGCSGADTISVVVNACVGIGESFVGTGMTIYPNPNAGSFTFTAADQNCNELTIEITTVEGKVLQSNMFSNVQGNFVQEINMNEYANGMYIMRVTTDGAVYTQRVVKQE